MKKNNITVVDNITTSAPKFKIGDTIYWYCDKEQRTHHARVKYVNYVHIGDFYNDINYEVESICCSEMKTFFIDENDAMTTDN
ncbi:MAG: hypothetical protein IKM99_09290 [Bacteroidales bacterium]|jgi:hypothetical protein|nr:hypothetical protein [Bacteroidales bacterium]MBR3711137.1 hypothetical protein [Bacteroidales bacterium]